MSTSEAYETVEVVRDLNARRFDRKVKEVYDSLASVSTHEEMVRLGDKIERFRLFIKNNHTKCTSQFWDLLFGLENLYDLVLSPEEFEANGFDVIKNTMNKMRQYLSLSD